MISVVVKLIYNLQCFIFQNSVMSHLGNERVVFVGELTSRDKDHVSSCYNALVPCC